MHSIFLMIVCLFSNSNCSHLSLEVVHLLLHFMPFFKVYCVVFICCTTRCHSLSLVVIGVTRCITGFNSFSFVVPLNLARNPADGVKNVYTERWQDGSYQPNNKKRRKKERKKERKRKAFRITTYASYGMKRGCYIMKNVHV